MSQNNNPPSNSKQKFCHQCGQKTFRPHRSVKELLWEFVENWFGYDSKAYRTARALIKPAALSVDYFRNSHHNNHYVTPIRLYIFLSIIFFLLTQFGGFNLTEVEFETRVHQAVEKTKAVDAIPEDIAPAIADAQEVASSGDIQVSVDSRNFDLLDSCSEPNTVFELWPNWLDNYFDKRAAALCESYSNIQYLPKEQQTKAKLHFGLSIGQSAIEVLPQAFLFTMPILALILLLLYLRQTHLYVEHLVLLIHSHCFIFSSVLIYLGWYQLAQLMNFLNYVPLGSIMLLWTLVYLYMSMKRFYQQGYFITTVKFLTFSLVYLVVFGFMCLFAMMAALISV